MMRKLFALLLLAAWCGVAGATKHTKGYTMRRIFLLGILAMVCGASGFKDTIYVDPAAAGAANGSSWTDAFTTLQAGLNVGGADTLLLCRGTETLSDTVDMNAKGGSVTTGYFVVRGVNASGVNDGTRYVLNAANTVGICMGKFTQGYCVVENIEFRDATAEGLNMALGGGGDYNVIRRCRAVTCGTDGFYTSTNELGIQFEFCVADSNTQSGFDVNGQGSGFLNCTAKFNTQEGIKCLATFCVYYGNLVYDNGENEENIYGGGRCWYIGNVIDGTNQTGETGLRIDEYSTHLRYNRITNCATGLNSNTKTSTISYTAFKNTDDTSNVSLIYDVRDKAAGSSNFWGIAADGYINAEAGDYNLDTSAVGRRVPIDY